MTRSIAMGSRWSSPEDHLSRDLKFLVNAVAFNEVINSTGNVDLSGEALIEKWEEQDSNLRRLSQQIYSLSRLTASVPSRDDFVKNPRSLFLSLRVSLDLAQLFQLCTV